MRWKAEQPVLDFRQERRVHNGFGAHPAPFPTSTEFLPRKDEKRGSEPDHLPQSATGVQNGWTYVSAPLIHLHSVVQVENFTSSPNPSCEKVIGKLKILNPFSCDFLCT